jgi:hypothetical protein
VLVEALLKQGDTLTAIFSAEIEPVATLEAHKWIVHAGRCNLPLHQSFDSAIPSVPLKLDQTAKVRSWRPYAVPVCECGGMRVTLKVALKPCGHAGLLAEAYILKGLGGEIA